MPSETLDFTSTSSSFTDITTNTGNVTVEQVDKRRYNTERWILRFKITQSKSDLCQPLSHSVCGLQNMTCHVGHIFLKMATIWDMRWLFKSRARLLKLAIRIITNPNDYKKAHKTTNTAFYSKISQMTTKTHQLPQEYHRLLVLPALIFTADKSTTTTTF